MANTEGQLVSQSGSIQTLNDSVELVTTTANGKGKVIYGSTAPVAADRLAQNLWIDTASGNNTPKRWNGTAWVAMSDKAATDALAGLTTKANASAVTALTTRVSTAEGTLTSQGNSLTSLNNSVGRMNAGGRFRMSTQATPTGAEARIGLHAEASDGQNTHTAGLFLVARTDGTSDVIAAANRFSIATGLGANDARTVPFIVRNGQVEITTAVIGDLTIGRGKIGNDSITAWREASATAALASSPTADVVLASISFVKERAFSLPLWFKATYPQGARLFLQRRIGTGSWTNLMIIDDYDIKEGDGSSVSFLKQHSGSTHTFVDNWAGIETVAYRVVGQTFGITTFNSGGGGSEASYIHNVVRAGHSFTNRFLGALVAYK
ncbi:DUF1983 domain-containing protein [Paracoccus sp. SSK6]|uniref:phage tail tip fiber protein n=1 Tax=Paracoccus sp. SSK6 TaxID=3143131 RepID=UPI003219FF88